MRLPFTILAASIFGLIIRYLFVLLEHRFEVMSVAMLILTPLLIGFITIFLLPKGQQISSRRAFFAPWLTCLVLLVVTMLSHAEGAICWIMIYPVFAIMAGVGGLVAHFIRKSRHENINRPNSLNISLIVLLPLFMGFVEGDSSSSTRFMEVQRNLVINATAEQVWHELTHIDTIRENEHHAYLSRLIGFPRHVATVLDTPVEGGNRIAYFEKGLYFKEVITRIAPQRCMVLAIKTEPDKVPPTVMDEHILIGGKHLDIQEDTYQLEPMSDHRCRLRLASKFTICTPFNWYAGLWARYMMQDILDGELRIIQDRAEQNGIQTLQTSNNYPSSNSDLLLIGL